jgi:TPR repeat protein
MIDLVKIVGTGEKVPGWDIESKLAVNLAYGTLLGKLDENVCDRIARIARDYEAGELVTKNAPLALRWYRLGADLGDTRAAWKVAQYHLDGEEVATDAEILFKYLNLAVNAGNDAAVLALAGMYEEGALVDRDSDKAIALYDQAISLKNEAALTKKVKLLANLEPLSSEYAASYQTALQELLASGNPPPWAVMRMSRLLQGREGYWAAAARSKELLKEAAARGDVEAKMDLGELLVAENQSDADLREASDLFTQVVKSDGEVRAVEDLVRFYTCIQPNEVLESHWTNIKESMGNDTVDIGPGDAALLSREKDTRTIAVLQTHSLYGRGSAIALFRRYLAKAGASDDIQEFWKLRVGESRSGALEEMYAQFQAKLKLGQTNGAREVIKPIDNDFNSDAGLTFARFLIENFASDPAALDLAKQIVTPLGEQGFGRAIQLLASLDGDQKTRDFTETMESRGDMASQLMLAEAAGSDAVRKLHIRRAVGSQRCDFNDAMTLGEYALRLDPEQAEHWLETAIRLSGANHWLEVKVADLYMSAGTKAAVARALALYRAGHDAQENSASYRLVKYYSDKTRKDYNPRMASDIFVDLIKRSELKDIPERLAMLANMKQDIRRQVSLRLNVPDLYRKAAETDQPVAMREYGKILRSENAGARSAEAFKWLQRAADFGDPEGMFLVSQSYAFGMGVAASDAQARVWLFKAAGAGSADAVKLRALVTGSEG